MSANATLTATLANPEKGIVALVYPDGTMHTLSVPESESILPLTVGRYFSLYVTSVLPEHRVPGVIQVFQDHHVEFPLGTPFQITEVLPSKSERVFGFHLFGYGVCLFNAEHGVFNSIRVSDSLLKAGILEDGSLILYCLTDGAVKTMLLSERPLSLGSDLKISLTPPEPPSDGVGYVHSVESSGLVYAINRSVSNRGSAMLFHGGPISCHSPTYDPLVDRLTSSGYRVYFPTYPCSIGIANPVSPEGSFRDMALAAIDQVKAVLRTYPHGSLILAGRSFGAWTALLAPSRELTPDRILAISPPVGISASLSKQESHADLDYLDALVVISGQRPDMNITEAYAMVEGQDLTDSEIDRLSGISTDITIGLHDPVTAFSGPRSERLVETPGVLVFHSSDSGHATLDLANLSI